MKISFNGVVGSREKVPAGVYKARVVSAKDGNTKRDNTGEPCSQWKFEVAEGEYEGFPVFGRVLLRPNTIFVLKNWLLALGANPKDLRSDFDTESCAEYEGDLCGIVVEVNDFGPQVRDVIPVEEIDNAIAKFAAAEQAAQSGGVDDIQGVFKI